MKVENNPPLHLTYCMNVHPGESWGENLAAVRDQALRVRDLIDCQEPFGLGLRLSAQAAETLGQPEQLREFRDFCQDHGLYVFTINGFPYGRFHDSPVKTSVYSPDWRQPERLRYTNNLIDILAALLPEGVDGSVSTVPGSYKPWITSPAEVARMVENLAAAAGHAARVRESTGKHIAIALEPEPDCFIEDTDETIAFFKGPLRDFGVAALQAQTGCSPVEAEAVLAKHIGLCFDTAHLAVAFEDLADSLLRLREAGIAISKIHLGAALALRPDGDPKTALQSFCEDVYLHQTRRRTGNGDIRRFADLDEALTDLGAGEEQWRVHFHVPLYFTGQGDLDSTQDLFSERFADLISSGITEHLEIETYTYGVLPPSMLPFDITEAIAREYEWVMTKLLA